MGWLTYVKDADRQWTVTLNGMNVLYYVSIPVLMFQGAVGVGLDVFVFILPIPLILRLRMPLSKRLQLAGLFGTALL